MVKHYSIKDEEDDNIDIVRTTTPLAIQAVVHPMVVFSVLEAEILTPEMLYAAGAKTEAISNAIVEPSFDSSLTALPNVSAMVELTLYSREGSKSPLPLLPNLK